MNGSPNTNSPNTNSYSSPAQAASASEACNICGGDEATFLFTKEGYHLVQCTSCGLVFVSNPPAASELKELYSFQAGYHSRFADEDDSFEKDLAEKRDYMQLIDKRRSPGRLLEIGCGPGFVLEAATECGWEVQGVELSADTAQIAQRRFGHRVHTGTLADADLRVSDFDAVAMWDVIEHVPDPKSLMRRVNGVLKEGGLLALSTPNVDGLFPKAWYPIGKRIDYWPHPEPPFHLYQFSKQTITALLERTGFRVVEMQDRRIPIGYTYGRA